MDEKYTYGYGLGWNVENEYMNSLKGIMDSYNSQMKKINELITSIQLVDADIVRNNQITEDQIRRWYQEDYATNNSTISFESYRKSILDSINEKNQGLKKDVEHNRERYLTDLKTLIKIKEDTAKEIHKKRNELDLLLSEKNIELSSILLEQRKMNSAYEVNRENLNSGQLEALNKRYDDVWLEIRKIEHAVKELNNMSELVKLTEEEISLKENDRIEEKVNLDENLEKEAYEVAYKEYLSLLEMYNEDLERLYELHQNVENNEIEYAEYEKFADYMVERYNYVRKLYNELKNKKSPYENLSIEEIQNKLKELEAEFMDEYYYRAHGENGTNEHNDDFINEYNSKKKALEDELNKRNNPFVNLSDEELLNKLKELEEEYKSEYQFRAHQENGMEEHKDNYLEDLQEKIKKIKEEIERRKGLEDLIEPLQPAMILDKEEKGKEVEEKTTNKVYNVKELLNRIAGNYTYTSLDSFIYTHKEIKCFNWNKRKERTFLDKPMKLFKTALSSVILGGSKLFSKAAYNRKDIKERIEFCIENVEKLTDEEVDFLFENLTPTRVKELQNILPKVVWNVLYNKFAKRIHFKLNVTNIKLKSYYLAIVNLYKEAMEIQNALNSGNLTPEERQKYEERLKQISKELCAKIMEYESSYSAIDKELNASGLYGIAENFRARRTNSIGGRNARYFDSSAGRGSLGILGRKERESLERGDGISAAKYFIHDQQIIIENTEEKRTLKNRFGKASVGIFQYSPLVEQADYSEDEYLRDVLQTIVIASSIVNMMQQMALRDQLLKANQEIQLKNLQIQQLNDDIDKLKGMFNTYNSDPNAFMQTYYTTLKNSLGGLQGTSEYLGMMAQAGGNTSMLHSAGSVYKMFDVHTHNLLGGLDKQLDAIFNNAALSETDKLLQMGQVYEQGVNEIARQAIAHTPNIQAHLNTFGNAYDFTSLMSVLNTAGAVNPGIITNVFNEYVEAAMFVNNMQALSYINTLNANVDLTAAVVALSGMVTAAELDKFRASKRENSNQISPDNQDIEEMKKEMLGVEIDTHKIAKERYEKAKEEWDSKGPFYKFFHRKEKPKRIDFDREALEELEKYENGRVL